MKKIRATEIDSVRFVASQGRAVVRVPFGADEDEFEDYILSWPSTMALFRWYSDVATAKYQLERADDKCLVDGTAYGLRIGDIYGTNTREQSVYGRSSGNGIWFDQQLNDEEWAEAWTLLSEKKEKRHAFNKLFGETVPVLEGEAVDNV